MKTKFFCAHGHFYQPPREDPWLKHIEKEGSAAPFDNWNRRILHECYLPNAFSQINDVIEKKSDFINNYAHMNFDFGPTLLNWLEKNHPAVYMEILEADRQSVKNFGHGNAIAQVYNHMIMPLASKKDKKTQIKWGLEYFRFKFARDSQGIWLAETAADEDTLEALCEQKIGYTILSPLQAARFRRIGIDKWEPANKISFDDTAVYRWFSKARPGKFVDIFFYNRDISDSITRKMNDTQRFYQILENEFSKDTNHQILSIASDGENYGHHLKNGNKGFSKLLQKIRREKKFGITNFASYLEHNKPEYQVEIVSPSSWSCPHGIGRWKDDCGCKINPQFKSQLWRKHLRQSLDWLSLKIDALYELKAKEYFTNPWRARNDYIVYRKRDHATEIKKFLTLASKGNRHLPGADTRNALKLLEMQKDRVFMFTSCAWFFDDITDIASINALKHALKSIETARDFGEDFYDEFVKKISKAESNIKGLNLKETINNIYRLKTDNWTQTANFAFSLFMDNSFPFETQSRFRNKNIAEQSVTLGEKSLNLYFISTENIDTFERNEFLAAISAHPANEANPRKETKQKSKKQILKCRISECKTTEEFNKLVASARADLKTFEIALDKAGAKIYDFSNISENNKEIFTVLLKYPEKDDVHAVMYQWLHSVKNFMPSDILSGKFLDLLRNFRKFSFKPGNIPFRDEIIKTFISHFKIILSKQSGELQKAAEWLKYLKTDPFSGYITEIKTIILEWKGLNPFLKIHDKAFFKSINEITNMLDIKFKTGLESSEESGRKSKARM